MPEANEQPVLEANVEQVLEANVEQVLEANVEQVLEADPSVGLNPNTETYTYTNTSDDDSRVTTTGIANSSASSSLSAKQIEAALDYVAAQWPNHPMTPDQREGWRDALTYMRPGELKPALAQCAGPYRPDAMKVLGVAQSMRETPSPYPVARPMPTDRATYMTSADWLQKCRDILAGKAKP